MLQHGITHGGDPQRTRGWPALSADPGRLRRVDPNLPIDVL